MRPTDMSLIFLDMTDHLPVSFSKLEVINAFAHEFDPSSASSCFFIHVSNFLALNLQSTAALSTLVNSLEKNCTVASATFVDPPLPFSSVFPSLARQLKPGKSHSLAAETLRRFLGTQSLRTRV
jgi:hypothetical protein